MKLWKPTIFGIVFAFVLLVWIFVIGVSSNQPGHYHNRGNNAVWLGHEWVGEAKTDAEIQELVNSFEKYGIGTVFVHSGPLDKDGNIDPALYEHSISFLDRARNFAPEIKYQAWLGQIRNKIGLDYDFVRANVAKQCQILGTMVGFDGIHFDIEPVWDEDMDFIETLNECRDIMPRGKLISVALAEFIPKTFIWLSSWIHEFENYNTEVNYENVGKYADQIVVMAYDTGFDKPWKYEWLVNEQVIWVTRLYDDKQVFIGIPTYQENGDAFDPEVENIETGFNGIIKGLNNLRSKEENFEGVALYSYWETDKDEWEIYENLWME